MTHPHTHTLTSTPLIELNTAAYVRAEKNELLTLALVFFGFGKADPSNSLYMEYYSY